MNHFESVPRRILCPIDFSMPAEAALAYAEMIARAFGAQLIVMHVVEPIIVPLPYELPFASVVDYEAKAKANALKTLASRVEGIRARGGQARALVTTGEAAERICALAIEEHVDLIVLSTHGYSGVKRMLLGSTAERVLRHSAPPVLTLRAPVDVPAGKASPRGAAVAAPKPSRPARAGHGKS